MDQDYLFIDQWINRRQHTFDSAANLAEFRFESDNGLVPQIRHARLFAQNWRSFSARGLGMLFWGPPGTGKTFAAACIANAFIESRERFAPTVIMTTFGIILRRILACTPQQREEYLERLENCDLLILDDFGMERQTDFAREQVFNLVNSRYLSGRPMVITTNLTLQQMKEPQTMAQQRIYDRVLEVCIPVCFEGESLRKRKAAENFGFYREITAASGSGA